MLFQPFRPLQREAAMEAKLKELSYNPEDTGSCVGVDKLYQSAKRSRIKHVKRDQVKGFLSDQHSSSIHTPARRHCKRNPTYLKGIDHQCQGDLADMPALSRDNQGRKYLLTVIDVCSKNAWAIPNKTISAKEQQTAFERVLNLAHPRKPQRLQTDAGKEFLNKELQGLLKREGIHHFYTNSDTKQQLLNDLTQHSKHVSGDTLRRIRPEITLRCCPSSSNHTIIHTIAPSAEHRIRSPSNMRTRFG